MPTLPGPQEPPEGLQVHQRGVEHQEIISNEERMRQGRDRIKNSRINYLSHHCWKDQNPISHYISIYTPSADLRSQSVWMCNERTSLSKSHGRPQCPWEIKQLLQDGWGAQQKDGWRLYSAVTNLFTRERRVLAASIWAVSLWQSLRAVPEAVKHRLYIHHPPITSLQ